MWLRYELLLPIIFALPIVAAGVRLILVALVLVLLAVLVMVVCYGRSEIVRAGRWPISRRQRRWWCWSVALRRVWWGRRCRDGRGAVVATAASARPVGGIWITIVVITGVGTVLVGMALAIAITTVGHAMDAGVRCAVTVAIALAACTLGHGRRWAAMGIMGQIRGRRYKAGKQKEKGRAGFVNGTDRCGVRCFCWPCLFNSSYTNSSMR